ncbi:antibiotic biosynthesis monooxygenase [Streptomyces noursei]|uniref:antibiotic biosynthesis monooxygenase n=1 Tax=Streptomyces noursei TaxID=1971 RepID=UPI00081CA537|nr:Antibiotic biosynthesis monooxygenase [Streptomyces noursei ATCC 11455]MCZ0993428.1 antibiotic biosynthesis monooxygenase [Streptomyces noursei]
MPPTADFPDVRRPDAATVLVSPWLVPEARFQRPAADAVLAAWEDQPRPDAMLALATFLSTDGSHVLNYAQWTDDRAHREWVRTRRPAAIAPVDEAVPGIRRPGPTRYRRYRSHVPEERPAARPGFLATPVFATTGPDAQRALADTVVDLLGRARVPGLLGAHFHLAQDGGRVLNYAEWADASARREFLAGGTADRLRAAIDALAGVTAVPAVPVEHAEHAEHATAGGPARPPVSGYRLYKTLVNVPSPRPR